ncbi:RNA-guided pseudouridylation complex pseudouridine synthase subunit Cbf5 [Halovenus sp. WSH3]|uniref:Probable tRNA pseudouridine synthase B n=1 Tax=Halovenus carboxidivorans TaxID=2692199 RepID=A0A6B0T750_9EURY|nr:RNA-guided pseudouridylation complex pseudouridine synthase subunit Cbf5 [Halovenus carboxidivorans]MXR51122.1 RNA-guided pseudouridylation complex pseudouridine synthase subunit Cbf5 [Halovenus carboxidivorans]
MSLRDPPGERTVGELLSFGVCNLDKPPGPTSHQVADWLKRLVNEAGTRTGDGEMLDRVAHTGTLDPKVTGSLPSLFGDATRLAQVFARSDKEYIAVLELQGPPPSDFEATLAEFEGEIYQKPPRKSAVQRQLRSRRIHDLDLLELDGRQALLRIRCEAGTYIRKLCHDIGLALGTGAHMGDLRRSQTGQFDDSDLVTMEEFADALAFWTEDGDEQWIREVVAPAERALRSLPRLIIAPSAAREVAEGAPVYAPGVIDAEAAPIDGTPVDEAALVACFTPNGSAVCFGRLVGDPDASAGTVLELERVLV